MLLAHRHLPQYREQCKLPMDIPTIFHAIRRYLEHPEERATAYAGENPLEAYIALYTAGGVDVQVAYAEAEALMASGKPSQLSVAALWYLERINQQKSVMVLWNISMSSWRILMNSLSVLISQMN